MFQESLYLDYKRQKEGQIHPKRQTDVTSCPTERFPGPCELHACDVRHNVTMAKNRIYVNMFFTCRSLVSCALLCVQTHTVYLAYFRCMDSDLSSGVMLCCAQFFGFTIRTVSKRDTFQLDVDIGTQSKGHVAAKVCLYLIKQWAAKRLCNIQGQGGKKGSGTKTDKYHQHSVAGGMTHAPLWIPSDG
jgi:hypothetical protein